MSHGIQNFNYFTLTGWRRVADWTNLFNLWSSSHHLSSSLIKKPALGAGSPNTERCVKFILGLWRLLSEVSHFVRCRWGLLLSSSAEIYLFVFVVAHRLKGNAKLIPSRQPPATLLKRQLRSPQGVSPVPLVVVWTLWLLFEAEWEHCDRYIML